MTIRDLTDEQAKELTAFADRKFDDWMKSQEEPMRDIYRKQFNKGFDCGLKAVLERITILP